MIVSHGADQLRRICDRVVVLDHGRLVGDGRPGDAIRVFREHMLADQRERQADVEARRVHESPAVPRRA